MAKFGLSLISYNSSKGWSPLDRSVWAGQREVAELLLAYGADVNITDSINRLERPLRSPQQGIGRSVPQARDQRPFSSQGLEWVAMPGIRVGCHARD